MKPSGATPRVGFFLTILRRCAVGAEATLEVEARPMAGPDYRENPHKLYRGGRWYHGAATR